MTQLYTLKLRRKSLVITDGGTTVGYKEETMHGLPGQLALTYQYSFPDAVMGVSQEAPEARRERRRSSAASEHAEPRSSRPAAAPRPEKHVAEASYADAINAALRSEK